MLAILAVTIAAIVTETFIMRQGTPSGFKGKGAFGTAAVSFFYLYLICCLQKCYSINC